MGALVMLVIASGVGGESDGEQGMYDTVYTFFKSSLTFIVIYYVLF